MKWGPWIFVAALHFSVSNICDAAAAASARTRNFLVLVCFFVCIESNFVFTVESLRWHIFFSPHYLLVFIEFDSRIYNFILLYCASCIFRLCRISITKVHPVHAVSVPSSFASQRPTACACVCLHCLRALPTLLFIHIFGEANGTLSGCILWLVCAHYNHLVSWFDRSICARLLLCGRRHQA